MTSPVLKYILIYDNNNNSNYSFKIECLLDYSQNNMQSFQPKPSIYVIMYM